MELISIKFYKQQSRVSWLNWCVFTLNVNRSRVATCVHQSTQENGHVGDITLGECRGFLHQISIIYSFFVIDTGTTMNTHSQYVEGEIRERTDNVEIERDLGSGHDRYTLAVAYTVWSSVFRTIRDLQNNTYKD